MHTIIMFIRDINININLFLEDIAFSMIYTKFLIRYYIGGGLNIASDIVAAIKNPNHQNHKWVNAIKTFLTSKGKTIDKIDVEYDCEHCNHGNCQEHTEVKSDEDNIEIITRQEEILPHTVDKVEKVEIKPKPIFNSSEIINDDIFMKYTGEEIADAKRISANPNEENDIDKVYKAINITEDILSTLQDKDINYDNIGKLNRLKDKVNNLYTRAKQLEKIERNKKKREMAESLMDNLLDDEVVNK